jgi:hypothetical protein
MGPTNTSQSLSSAAVGRFINPKIGFIPLIPSLQLQIMSEIVTILLVCQSYSDRECHLFHIDGCEVTLSSSHKIVDEDIKNSSASILSTDTRSSRSSVSSRSSSHSDDNQTSPEEKEGKAHKKDEPPEFLIVLLGDKLDRDPTSWHG